MTNQKVRFQINRHLRKTGGEGTKVAVSATDHRDMRSARLRRLARALFEILIFLAALSALHYSLAKYSYHDVTASLQSIPKNHILLALGFTCLNYLIMTFYDVLAFRYIGAVQSYPRIALASFIGYAFTNNAGSLSIVAGSSIRYRLYSAWGLSATDIARIVAFCTVSFWLGLIVLGGTVFLINPIQIHGVLRLPMHSTRPMGAIMLSLAGAYMIWIILKRKPLKIIRWEFPLPPASLSLAQIAVSCVDWTLAAWILYILLPTVPDLPFPAFLGLFLLSELVGIASNVPGGIGVFEGIMLLLLAPYLPASTAMGALISYRGIYYILPLCSALMLLGTQELLQQHKKARLLIQSITVRLPALIPHILAAGAFLAGTLLLFSGASPAVPQRLAWLKHLLPLSVLEISHFAASLTGAALLVLARGLQRRLNAAYFMSIILLAAGIVFSLLKGVDYEEATVLGFILMALLPCRKRFYRKTSLIDEPFSPAWTAAIIVVFAGSVWLGFFSYRHTEYTNDLWWHFAFRDDAPKFLRATVGAATVMLIFAMARLLRPALPSPATPSGEELEAAALIARKSEKTYAYLALLGDKSILFDKNRSAFVMYGIKGRSWIAMGDPVGTRRQTIELAWHFRDLCDHFGGYPVFYQVDPENLPVYIDLGMNLIKIGEEGRVRLRNFSLRGASRKSLRHAYNRARREGYSFEIIPEEQVPEHIPRFREISDTWLAQKNTREKSFSLGFFNESYLMRFPAAVIRYKDTITAFANLWPGGNRRELSVDLMRFHPETAHDVMDYLFIELMLWGREQGYGYFNLGMAPLAGLEDHALAPAWSKMGALVFRYGEHFYNFQGVRRYKEKFEPVWKPKYLAFQPGRPLPIITADIASLISRGIGGIFSK